ncbi:MAG: RNA 3'-terminal phosphate cyclase [Methanotrichaceae archaeon]
MIEIDGSHGEGGGQIVRTAVALSAVVRSPIKITKIRCDRPNPGLSFQHVRAIEILARITNARTEGVTPGSAEVIFEPDEIRGGRYEIDIGTAGSLTLLIQCLLPALVHADGPTVLRVRGGTDVKWSPTIDYLYHVALPTFGLFGAESRLSWSQRGYYPRGGGMAVLEVMPSKLKSADLKPAASKSVKGISHCSNLPEHVAQRQADAAIQVLDVAGYDLSIKTEVLKGPSTGSGITLWSGHVGASALGERGLRAEKVGTLAAEEMLNELDSGASVDVHLADQLVPYLALAGGSYTARQISEHTRTNIWTANQFLDSNISVNLIPKMHTFRGKKDPFIRGKNLHRIICRIW